MAFLDDNTEITLLVSGYTVTVSSPSSDLKIDVDNLIAHLTTSDLLEGANLYYTDERNDDRTAALIQNGTGVTWNYDDGAGTLTPTVSLSSFDTSNLPESTTLIYNRRATLSIDHPNILTLNATPQTIINNGGGGGPKAVAITGAVAWFDNNDTTAYTNSGIDIIDASTGNVLVEFASGLLNSATDKYWFGTTPTGGVEITGSGDIQVQAKTSDPTGGGANNALKIALSYYEQDMSGI